ncbi:hypothetical protein J3B02_005537 [Coemansia erecta]|uniref:ADF-H domain-containing protein n=1 Tax=Coemansia asiatica TaxID=1052880 RepID=A0A9W8CI29_9FUNG|nr:hypothetical protein LPJ64_004969 [Coemansia asiatica]KAJ2842577.1 hypothetical protein J3B02_005537 [Coemansia erecta]KAJ2887003.1 hypothetical protein FB639_001450 [Coemansia asiatica]
MASVTCTIDPSVIEDVKKVRFGTTSAKSSSTFTAYVAKISSEQKVVMDPLDDVYDLESLVAELPDDTPRYIVMSYKKVHEDERVSYPLVFIYYCPETASPSMRMLYASTQQLFEKQNDLGKSRLLQKKEDLTQEWLDNSKF